MCHAIGNARDLHHFRNVVDANDVHASQNACCDRSRGAPDALFWRNRFSAVRERRA